MNRGSGVSEEVECMDCQRLQSYFFLLNQSNLQRIMFELETIGGRSISKLRIGKLICTEVKTCNRVYLTQSPDDKRGATTKLLTQKLEEKQ